MRKIFFASLLFLSAFISISTWAEKSNSGSLFDIKSQWRNVEDKKAPLSFMKGNYTLITMVYTGCAHACPMTISKIQKIDKTFTDAGFKDVKIVLASFDVKQDRPAKLKKYQESRKLNLDKWSFLAAETEADARELSVALGISYKDIGNGDFSHSNIITLLDPEGRPVASIDGLNASDEGLLQALKDGQSSKK